MSQIKKPAAAVLAFRQSRATSALPDSLVNLDYLVPMTVKSMGQLIGVKADAAAAEWDPITTKLELLDAYKELATNTAILLNFFSVEAISDEAASIVHHRLATTVDPLVSLNARVDHLYRSYVSEDLDELRQDVQKLWVALEFRCEAVTAMTFGQLLAEV